ncbi:MAG: beta-galactosidase, partial [Clostridia bacterium]|nr:beta-galactosidase [Clostridia bacterium]
YTSPIYREKVRIINEKLSERYGKHPAVLMWHLSNEYRGECHCPLCQAAFRDWLKARYNGDLDALNHAYWTAFWSHQYTDWSQVEPPSARGDFKTVPGLVLDWKRFVTEQTTDFIRAEAAAVRKHSDLPVTTNLMTTFDEINYAVVKDALDIISWDAYPYWHSPEGNAIAASRTAFNHDWFRAMKPGKPYILMESTPQAANWHVVSKLKRPGMHKLSCMQAIAHGSDSAMYFQWRKGRGGLEKFHGAVVDHVGHEHTRSFKEIAETGALLSKLDSVVGTGVDAQVALVYDIENRWALDTLSGMVTGRKGYTDECQMHYHALWKQGIKVDVIDMHADYSKYKMVIAPMLYMAPQSVVDAIERYVANGGIFIGTYTTGTVNETDLCYLGGRPAGVLKDVFGLWAEELDVLYPEDKNEIDLSGKRYPLETYFDVAHPSSAEELATVTDDYYAGNGAIFKNKYGKGSAYYIAFRSNQDFYNDFYASLTDEFAIIRALPTLPEGVSAHTRNGGFLFIENYNSAAVDVMLDGAYINMETGETVTEACSLGAYGIAVLQKN